MTRYHIAYQASPFAQNESRILLVDAENRVQAAITAFATLTERGFSVAYDGPDKIFSEEEKSEIASCGIPFRYCPGTVFIRSITEYTAKSIGRIVEG